MPIPPTASSRWSDSEQLVRLFQRHVVPIQLTFSNGKDVHRSLISSFIMSIRNRWLLVTAGHCIRDVKQNEDSGYRVQHCFLLDSMGHGATFREAYPINWADSFPHGPFEDRDNDFGLIAVNGLTRSNLERNGIVPINEQAWESQPDAPEGFFLIGMPDELCKPGAPTSQVTSVMLRIEPAKDRPPDLEDSRTRGLER